MNREAYKQDSEARYLSEREKLLKRLVSVGKDAISSTGNLEKLYVADKDAIEAAECKGVKLQYKDLQYHIYVSEEVTEALNEVYTQYYQKKPGIRIADAAPLLQHDGG